MPEITFSYPHINEGDPLRIRTGANNISWAYNLNTQRYPTYGGEVVQVLSVNIDNLRIDGDVESYAKMEEIYRFFLKYMQRATQGAGGVAYDESPVTMTYPERGWTLQIQPLGLPGLRYGRDVVVPTWNLQANIVEPDPDMGSLSIDHALNVEEGSALEEFHRVEANIGYRFANPYSDPLGILTAAEHESYPGANLPYEGQVAGASKSDVDARLKGLAKQMNANYEAILKGGNVVDLLKTLKLDDISKPTDPSTSSQTVRPAETYEVTPNGGTSTTTEARP
jgi:hypothetical protein